MSKYLIFLYFLCNVFVALSLVPQAQAQSRVSLGSEAGQSWKVKPQADAGDNVNSFFQSGSQQNGWVKATVPGTVYAAYVDQGLEVDPNFSDNIWKTDRAKFDKPFWYITSFKVPVSFNKEKIWLNFNGVNRKADVYLNGEKLGTVDNFMDRKKFDVSSVVLKDGENKLAVLIDIPRRPMANQASPTYVSSGGWDWMPYIPGLNSGITDKIFLTNTGSLSIGNPWIQTKLPTNARADLRVSFDILNHSRKSHTAYVKGLITPGNIEFTQKVAVEADVPLAVTLDKRQLSQLVINSPKLWWPNGYGEQNLYTCNLTLLDGTGESDRAVVKFGIKQYSFDTIGNVLHISINGKRVFVKGGNWGMSEYMLRCRGKEYDTKVRLHKEMNFNMIRNWVGSTTDEEFYEACDKYGIMVWDDFWLNSNPNLPRDINEFNTAVIEKIKRFRNHPSVAVWCGDNEGWPEAPLNNWIKENIRNFDGNDRYYQANSHDDNLSGSGPWANKDPRYYFTPYPTGLGGRDGWGFRTEIGTAVFTNVESFKKFMPKENWWPRNDLWEKHYFGPWAFNANADQYESDINTRYGKAKGIEDFCRKAQLLNIETNKAMYEGWLDNMWEDASGVMTWMSNASIPSLIWQTYDYYYDLTGAYFGIKNACQPLHIQWNPVSNSIKVINTTGSDISSLIAEADIYNLDGSLVKKYSRSVKVASASNTAVEAFELALNPEKLDLALNKPAVASSSASGEPGLVTDAKEDTRWASKYTDKEWIYVDLGKDEIISGVGLNFEEGYAKSYKIQVSSDAVQWRDVYTTDKGRVGMQEAFFAEEITGRYVRMLGMQRGSWWGYSLWDFKVYAGNLKEKDLSPVHFIKLRLKDNAGKLVSDNFYWRGSNRKDFTALNQLKKVDLKVNSKTKKADGKYFIDAQITNPASSPSVAFGIRIQALKARSREQILPAVISDGYFSLLKGETKTVRIEFDEDVLGNDTPQLKVEPYNNRD
ncbi:glycosyl hydrolase 2 galactose-binding domain-containing protein [Desertivirga xinjiangensis]|uniref:glycosyl hydrolase 2 galactose-binding domain-containing protein n=1 Tax=Desertivirga xinjiangensis TaxID=539206 RepID=UPI00210B4E95|nr:discoidin domain-containing protein [Pedobacter xinjiangensis]